MNAWFAFAGSTEMLDTARAGVFVAVESIRVNATDAGSVASAFFEMKTRPPVVAAQSVELSPVARESQLTLPPLRLVPYGQVGVAVPAAQISRPLADGSPSFAQSPHCTAKSPVNRLQCWSRYACGPPSSVVRHACWRPANSEPCTVGSLMIGK